MTREPDFNELVGEDVPAEERERLRRAHDLLLAAGPVPELPPGLEEPSFGDRPGRLNENAYQLLPRRRTGAALALAVPLHAASGLAVSAKIEIGKRDSHGNWPLRVEARGLPKLKNGGYYEMYLTHGTRSLTCGTFAGGGPSTVKVRLTVPYSFHNGDGWIVTKQLPGHEKPGPTVLTT